MRRKLTKLVKNIKKNWDSQWACFFEFYMVQAKFDSFRFDTNTIPSQGTIEHACIKQLQTKTEKWNKRFVETNKLPKSQQTKTITHIERYTQSLDSTGTEEQMMWNRKKGNEIFDMNFFLFNRNDDKRAKLTLEAWKSVKSSIHHTTGASWTVNARHAKNNMYGTLLARIISCTLGRVSEWERENAGARWKTFYLHVSDSCDACHAFRSLIRWPTNISCYAAVSDRSRKNHLTRQFRLDMVRSNWIINKK